MVWWKGNANFPCKFNPTTVRVEPLKRTGDVSEELLDEDFLDKTGPYERTSFTVDLKGQPFFEKYEKHISVFGGDTKPTHGRIVFKTTELDRLLIAKGLTQLENGDRIILVGSRTVDLLIIEVRPVAWMGGGQNVDSEPAMTAAYFQHNSQDRSGSRTPR